MAAHFVTSPHELYPDGGLLYAEAGTWVGALRFAEVIHDEHLRDELIRRFQPLLPGGAEANRVPTKDDALHAVFGIVPLQLYMATKDPKYFVFGKSFADAQWDKPLPNGLSHQTSGYVDADMYMLPMLQLQAYRATGEHKYLDRGAAEMVAAMRKLQQPNGLFYHTPEFPFFWARGEGWAAAGMTEMLLSLPAEHPHRSEILTGYRKMMAALLHDQAQDGAWRQLVDHPEAWEDSSGTGMFAFALITGVKNDWLPGATFGPAARNAWLAATGFIDQHDDVTSISEGVFDMKPEADWYLGRRRKTGDFAGQEPILWAATALLQPPK